MNSRPLLSRRLSTGALVALLSTGLSAPAALAAVPSDRSIDRIINSLPAERRSAITDAQMQRDETEAAVERYATEADEGKFRSRAARDELKAALVRFKAERVALREARQSGDAALMARQTQAFQTAQQSVYMHRALIKLWQNRRVLAGLRAAHGKLWVDRCESLVRLRRLELYRDQTSSSDLDLLGEISEAQADLVKREERANRAQARVLQQESKVAQWAGQVAGFGGTP